MEGEQLMRALEAMEHARVIDFMRFVDRQLRERDDLAGMGFRDGFYMMIGYYAMMSTEDAGRL